MTPKKLTAAQERAKAKLRSYWLSAWHLDENTRTLEVLVKRGLAEMKLSPTGLLFRKPGRSNTPPKVMV